jgi:hypothetical protein
MRTISAGLRALRRAPLAVGPALLEGAVAALLIGLGVLREAESGAAAGAAFPLGSYFDLKQTIGLAPSWFVASAAILLSILVRGASLSLTLWLSEGRPGAFAVAWMRGILQSARAAVFLLPAAGLMFIGVATRYAPFLWLAAVLGVIPSVALARRAVRMDVGRGAPRGSGVPEIPAWLAYAYLVAASSAALSLLDRVSPVAAAALLFCLAPFHALFLLGWREHLRDETYPGGGTAALAITAVVILFLAGASVYDRLVREPSPVGRTTADGSLLLLGGADSTSRTGALTDFDARDLGYNRSDARLLSYRRDSDLYAREDTRGDLAAIAGVVSNQIASALEPRALLGHSQAALILDRILRMGLEAPERAVVIAASSPAPPWVDIPPPGKDGRGRVGGDIARAFAHGLDLVGLTPFNVDAPASPTNLEQVVVADQPLPRLAVWALADSIWLEGDWRRPGETNIVVLTDHVGATNNGRTVEVAREFLAGRRVADDSTSWRGLLVSVLRYAFSPWRPW